MANPMREQPDPDQDVPGQMTFAALAGNDDEPPSRDHDEDASAGKHLPRSGDGRRVYPGAKGWLLPPVGEPIKVRVDGVYSMFVHCANHAFNDASRFYFTQPERKDSPYGDPSS